MYLKMHQAIANHPKTLRLMRELGWSRAQAVGAILLLNFWALDYASDGDISRYEPDDLAVACDYQGDPATLVEALVTARWLDRKDDSLTLHDWEEYGGKVVREYMRERDRSARRYQDRKQSSPDGSPAEDQRLAAATEEKRTEKKREAAKPPLGDGEDAEPDCPILALPPRALEELGWVEVAAALTDGEEGKLYNLRADAGRAFRDYRVRACAEAQRLSAGLGPVPSGCDRRRPLCVRAIRNALEDAAVAREGQPGLRPGQLLRQLLQRQDLFDDDDITDFRYLEKSNGDRGGLRTIGEACEARVRGLGVEDATS